MSSERTRKSTNSSIVRDDNGEIKIRKIVTISAFDLIERVWQKRSETTTFEDLSTIKNNSKTYETHKTT